MDIPGCSRDVCLRIEHVPKSPLALLAGSGQELWRWRVADWSKQRELKLPRPGGDVMRATWSRDGKRLAAITTVHGLPEPTEAALVVWDVEKPVGYDDLVRNHTSQSPSTLPTKPEILASGSGSLPAHR